ncbi:Pao retrotransposon peptidase [Popillia japonica]|uniref:Pao retrotransposon peptidase n=1 Tax=Popillia japonica TaxID=7064 RepID=A0AAW1MB00_POPJA
MSKDTIKALKAERSYVKGSVTRFASYLNKLSDDTDLVEVQSRYDNYKALLEQYHEIQLKITKLDETEVDDQEITEFEDSYYTLVKKAKHVLASKDVPSIKPVKPETEGTYVLTADIAKMYRQVMVKKEHTPFQRILWRENQTDEIKTASAYELKTVTYGTASASYLAIKALQQLAQNQVNIVPLGSEVILRDFYVDDLANRCRYTCRCHENPTRSSSNVIMWFKCSFNYKSKNTNAGNLAILMQEIWQLKLNWDESLPLHIQDKWICFTQEIESFSKVQIPRRGVSVNNAASYEIHGFCDASEKA